MAKKIKFNLVIDKQPIRDIEDLRNNFNVEDVLEAFQNGSLERWLDVCGLDTERALLAEVQGDDPAKAKALCGIFLEKGAGTDLIDTEIETAAYSFEFKRKERESLSAYENIAKQEAEVIARYHKGYEILLDLLEGKAEDYAFLKPAIEALVAKYMGLFKLNAADFYNRFIIKAPMVILAVLANAETRRIAENVWKLQKVYEAIIDNSSLFGRDKGIVDKSSLPVSDKPDKLVKNHPGLEELKSIEKPEKPTYTEKPAYIKCFAGATDGHFTHLEPAGKRFMIIQMKEGNIVMKRDGLKDDELKAPDVNGKFVILDGVDYCGKNGNDQLIYVEV